MDIQDRFGAETTVEMSDPAAMGFFLVQRKPDVDHKLFLQTVLAAAGGADRLLFHHQNGLAVIRISFHTAQQLEGQPMISLVGGIHVDLDRLRDSLLPTVPE